MASSPQSRVLRCCSCRLFQTHQVKKSLKWTCKACGEKQSFMRAYGEGSGADCRHHVQKLNLLQGQVSELSLRSLGAAVNAGKENAGRQQAENGTLQGKSQHLENRWLKYLDKGSPEKELEEGVCFHTQPSSNPGQPGPPSSQALPRKRKWSQSTDQPPQTLVQDSDDPEVTLEPQEGYTNLIRTMQQDSNHYLQNSMHYHTRELSCPRWKLPSPAPQLKAQSSKWARFLLSSGNSSYVDTEVPRPLQRGSGPTSPAQAEQGTPRTETPREGHPSRPTTTTQCPQATHTPMTIPERPCRKTAEQSWSRGPPLVQGVKKAPPVQLCGLFTTGEDFDDDL